MNALIASQLAAFAARRRRLLLWRGGLAAGALLLATMMAVALLDRYFIIPDWLRGTLSAAAYLAAGSVILRTAWLLLWRQPDERRLARLLERTAPELREDLLSAVELSRESEHFDSPRFRELVQEGVAGRMAGLQVERLLPSQLIRPVAVLAAALLLALVFALVITRLQFGAMLLRAALPMANLPRVSTVHIAILSPNPAEMPVPQGDSVALAIETSGAPVSQAFLETFSTRGSRGLVQMNATGRDRFSGQIEIARDDVEYRVRAGDALTRKFRLQAAARPRVVHFHKTVHFPEYAQLPRVRWMTRPVIWRRWREARSISPWKPISQLRRRRFESKPEPRTSSVPLERDPQARLHARLSLNASGSYRVHLVSAASVLKTSSVPSTSCAPIRTLSPRSSSRSRSGIWSPQTPS